MGNFDHFEGEDVIITFEKEGADSVINFEAKVTNISLSGGTSDVETVRTFGGNSIQIQKPSGEYEISFDYVTKDSTFAFLNLDSTTTGNMAAGTEYRSGTESSKKRFRIVLWILGEGASVAESSGVVVPEDAGEIVRYIFKDCYSVSNDEEFSAEEYMKGTISFKTGSTDEDGYANVFKE